MQRNVQRTLAVELQKLSIQFRKQQVWCAALGGAACRWSERWMRWLGPEWKDSSRARGLPPGAMGDACARARVALLLLRPRPRATAGACALLAAAVC